MARGKIARLPRHIRNQLSRRLDDGEGGELLLEWLNGLPEVKKLCAMQSDSAPVSKQNLSDFKQGPHQEWVRGREACELAPRTRSSMVKDSQAWSRIKILRRDA